ncbi:MAG: class 1b ribonucleoside-diphosphate reductase subunit alpha [Firmicutes bacterium]|nr:class 1b ribonucleoside-diphosphate reductase subunit alpha [Bacillota bacterium]
MSKDYHRLNSQVFNINPETGFFDLEKDLEARDAFLLETNQRTHKSKTIHEHILYLVKEGLYEDFYLSYSEQDIDIVWKAIKTENFQFASYMSAAKFYKDYALKTGDKQTYLETYEHRTLAVALHTARGDVGLAKDIALVMIRQQYQPATPTFLDAGKARRGELVSCFLLEMDDDLNSISFQLGTSMYLSKVGGGVALNLSKLRARGEEIKGIQNAAKGVMPVLKLLEDGFNYADKMGQRKGAGAAYLNIFHADVEEFLDTKKINADEKSRIQTLSLGLTVPNKFFDLAKTGEDYYVFYPYTVRKKYDIHLDEMDMSEWYEKLVADPDIKKKKLDARAMLTNIAKTQFESGYPYIVYIDTANKHHALKDLGRIKMSNLCTEIFQLQTPSVIRDYYEKDDIGFDISCVLGSLNIVNVMEGKNIEFAVKTATEALTNVSDLSTVTNAPSVYEANNAFHSIGLGAMNLHGYLAKNLIPYESPEAVEFVSAFFAAVNFYSIRASMIIAKRRAEKFHGFERSEYHKGAYFNKYLKNHYNPTSDRVKELFKGIKLPTQDDWAKLKADVREHGMFNAYRLTIAPNQAISYIQNSTASIQPVVDAIEVRTYGNAKGNDTTYYPMPYLSKKNILLYKSSYTMDQTKIIDLVAAAQEHIDQGISTVLYVTSMATTRDLVKLYLYAFKKGLKSLYYTRTKNLTIEECLLCSV